MGPVIMPASAAPIVAGVMPGTIVCAVLRPSRLVGKTNAVETDGYCGQRHQNGECGEGERGLLYERHRMSSMFQVWKRSGGNRSLREDNAACDASILARASDRGVVIGV
jgi:hypothetical protein